MSHVKRMFSINEATDAILGAVDTPASEYVRQAILNNYLPVYSKELRAVALRLLDIVVGGQKYIGKFQSCDLRDEVKWALENTLKWVATHHIESPALVKQLLSYSLGVKMPESNWESNQTVANFTLAQIVNRVGAREDLCKSDLLHIIQIIGMIESEYITAMLKREPGKEEL